MITTNKTYAISALIDNVPVPAATHSYTPTPHRQLVGEVMKAFDSYGFTLKDPVHAIHKKKSRFHTVFDVVSSALPERLDLSWQVGLINSYDQSKAIHIVFGGRVFVCANGMVIADYKLKTRHTTHVWDRIPDLISAAASRFDRSIHEANARHQLLMDTRIGSRASMDAFAVEVCRRNLLPVTKAVEFADEIHNPSFNYEVKEDTLWNVHNAFTHMAKGFDPSTFANKVVKFDRLLDGVFLSA